MSDQVTSDRKLPEFPGNDRFLIQQRLGAGGFGVVYQVYDRERNAIVALKMLRQTDAEALYRFKQEFRALADINHPNLVTLYELLSEGGQWFFTMELVHGIDFLQYVRASAPPPGQIDQAATVSRLNLQQTIGGQGKDSELETAGAKETARPKVPAPVLEAETLLTPVNRRNSGAAELHTNATAAEERSESTAADKITGANTAEMIGEQTAGADIETARFNPNDSFNSLPPSLLPTTGKLQFRLDPIRLRAALSQLVAGISALHQAGKLHRDIKPSNVLVTADGRVVILDFGIVTELRSQQRLSEFDVVGTPAYMSPEQSAAMPLSEATDWYSVGVMLYEALTGQRPFTGKVADVMIDKQRLEPPPPSRWSNDIPPDLDLLCQKLLRRNAERRPTGRQILKHLSSNSVDLPEAELSVRAGGANPFVGRDHYLTLLQAAFDQVKQMRRTATVYIQGRSGMGKSALVRHFLNQLQPREFDLVILAGRCYEQESVPYKALDSLIDALSQYLKQLPISEINKLLPADLAALARLFPVLMQVPKVAEIKVEQLAALESQELRRLAFSALRELLTKLAQRVPLILYIDDLQWGDLDSAGLLLELLQPPSPPPFLLITTFRSEDVGSSPLLTSFLPMRAQADTGIDVIEIAIKELSVEESQQLALSLLGNRVPESLARATRIAQEARGNPFFVDELVRYSQQADADHGELPINSGENSRETDSGITRLDQVIQARVIRLPMAARRLLEVIAVAGQPLNRTIAKQAVAQQTSSSTDQKDNFNEQAAFALLRTNHMIRVSGNGQQEELETYHDRIRETVVNNLAPATLQEHHGQLALLLEAEGQADAERLTNHFHKAGNNEQAAKYAVAAAAKADSALAFDQAARLYQLALDLRQQSTPTQQQSDRSIIHNLQIKLAEALTNAGRGYQAAQCYLRAVDTARDDEALALRQRAADQLLRTGHLEQGFIELRIITDKVGIKIAKTPVRALLSFLWQRLKIHWRGLDYQERAASEVAASDLLKLDTFWSVSTGLSMIDATRGVELQARHLLFALKVGEPQRIARALAAEAGYTASAGGRKAAHTEYLLKLTSELSTRLQYPYAMAISATVTGIAAGCNGQWRRCIAEFARAAAIYREHCTGVSSELDTGNYWTFTSLYFIGDFNQLFERLPAVLKDLGERSNLFGETNLRLRTTYMRLLTEDRFDEAKIDLDETIGRWSQPGFQMQHFWHLFGQVQTRLYAGEAEAAWQLLNEKWPIIAKSLLLRIQSFYMQALHLRSRCLLARLAQQPGSGELLKQIDRDTTLIEKENMPWGNAFAEQLRAALAVARGDLTSAIALAARAEQSFHAVDMALYANVLRRRRGQLMGGEPGRELIESADQWMRNQQIANPSRFADMLAPGRWAEKK